jgi:hypothetical protein
MTPARLLLKASLADMSLGDAVSREDKVVLAMIKGFVIDASSNCD